MIRQLEIIGEAANNLSDKTLEGSKLPWSSIVAMRNKLAHEYFGVDLKIVWKTIETDLPPLKSEFEQILKNFE